MSSDSRRTILKVVVGIVVVFSAASLVLFYYQSIRNFFRFHEIDFTSYLRASDWFFDGLNPYQEVQRRFLYPLFLLIVVQPLAWLQTGSVPRGISIALWSLGSYVAFFAAIGAVWKRFYGAASLRSALTGRPVTLAILVAMLHPYLQDEFLNGQVNLFVMGATAGFFVALSGNRQLLAAVLLSAAISIKISPGLCLFYALLSGQYRAVAYTAVLVPLFALGIPWLVNPESGAYYRYFISDVMPRITGSDFEGGFRSYSVISTVSYLFHIAWHPPLKILAVCALALLLFSPVVWLAPRDFGRAGFFQRFAVFSTMITIVPLTFPMSEAHHLLLLTLPFLAVLAYWHSVIESPGGFWRDRLSLWFLVCVVGLHLGHGLKDTPIRLLCLIAMYLGMLQLLKKLKDGAVKLPLAASLEKRPMDAPIIPASNAPEA